jgi:Ca2+-binding EF-hand superfamily protein
MNQKDKYQEGILSREDIYNIISEAKVSELSNAEINILMKHSDRTTKGYVSINNFLEKLLELTTETKLETYLRTFSMNVKR